jgi:hypothetical protein
MRLSESKHDFSQLMHYTLPITNLLAGLKTHWFYMFVIVSSPSLVFLKIVLHKYVAYALPVYDSP